MRMSGILAALILLWASVVFAQTQNVPTPLTTYTGPSNVMICANPTTGALISCNSSGSVSLTGPSGAGQTQAASIWTTDANIGVSTTIPCTSATTAGCTLPQLIQLLIQAGQASTPAGTANIGVVTPYALPGSMVQGTITTAMTVTTSTLLLAAPGVSLRNYITEIVCGNASTTVGTWIDVQDGNGGTVIYQIPAGTSYQGGAITFPVPLRQPTLNNALYVVNETTGASTKCSATGFSAS